jgi:predicted RNA-binding protein YlxR (DUF448 family)
VRIVRSPDGVFVDPTGKMAGRGAYLHENLRCWELGMENALSKALKTELTTEDRQRLTDFMSSLPED